MNHVDSTRLPELLKDVLKATYEFGITVKSVVFDELAVNIGMASELDANLKFPTSTLPRTARKRRSTVLFEKGLTNPFIPYFSHPSTRETVYMLKL